MTLIICLNHPVTTALKRGGHNNWSQAPRHNIKKTWGNTCILHKLELDFYMTHWLLRQNHTENEDKEIKGMKLSINAINAVTDILSCM